MKQKKEKRKMNERKYEEELQGRNERGVWKQTNKANKCEKRDGKIGKRRKRKENYQKYTKESDNKNS